MAGAWGHTPLSAPSTRRRRGRGPRTGRARPATAEGGTEPWHGRERDCGEVHQHAVVVDGAVEVVGRVDAAETERDDGDRDREPERAGGERVEELRLERPTPSARQDAREQEGGGDAPGVPTSTIASVTAVAARALPPRTTARSMRTGSLRHLTVRRAA